MNPTITPTTDIDAAHDTFSSIAFLLADIREQITRNDELLGRTEQQPISQQPTPRPQHARTVADWVELMRAAMPAILSDGKPLAAHDISSAVLRLHPLRVSEANDGLIRVNAAKNVLTDKGFLVRKKVIGGTFLYQLAK